MSKVMVDGLPMELVSMAVEKVIPTPDNPRVFPKEPNGALLELAESIRAQGVLEPVLCRPHPTEAGCLDMRAGERRWRASQLAGRMTIPCLVREMSDEDAFAITAMENIDREDLTPLEEGRCFRAMLDHGYSIQEIADRVGKAASWVARRAELTKLHPKIQEKLAEDEALAAMATAPKLELIARLPEEVQKEFAKNLWSLSNVFEQDLAGVRETLADEFNLLKLAPWPLAEPLGVIGPCDGCPSRTDAQPLLFADMHEGEGDVAQCARCLNAECWKSKQTAWSEKWLAEMKEKHPGLKVLTSQQAWNLEKCGKTAEGAFPAVCEGSYSLYCAGSKELKPGKVHWVRLVKKQAASSADADDEGGDGGVEPGGLEEKIGQKNRIRREWIGQHMLDVLGALEGDELAKLMGTWDRGSVLLMVSLFGVDLSAIATGGKEPGGGFCPFKLWNNPGGVDEDAVVLELAVGAAHQVMQQFRYLLVARRVEDEQLTAFADIFQFDLPGLRVEAAKAKPYPKSWGVADGDAAQEAVA